MSEQKIENFEKKMEKTPSRAFFVKSFFYELEKERHEDDNTCCGFGSNRKICDRM